MNSKQECEQRVARLQAELAGKGVDGALLIYPIDVYYFAGTRQNAVLWVPAEGEAVLMVRKSLSRARGESPLADIRPFPSSRSFHELFPSSVRSIGLTFDVLPVAQYNYYQKLLPAKDFVDLSSINRKLRSVKSDWELARMRECAAKLCSVFAQVPGFLKAGMREIDLAAEFEARARRAGLEGQVRMRAFNQELYQGLAVSGASATTPGFFDGAVTGKGLSCAAPHGASEAVIEKNVPVLLDYTGVLNGYIVDMTRMFVVGKLGEELQHAFRTALTIQSMLQKELKPGEICSELFTRAAEMPEEAGLGMNFMGVPGEQARFVGHGVGLELDEMPVLAQGFDIPLEANQTIAIEPKFLFPGIGAVGIENTFAVTERGGEVLTAMDDALACV